MRRFLLAALVGTLVLSATAPAMARHAPASAKSAKASVTAAQPAKQAPDLRVGLASGRASLTITPAGGKATVQTGSSKTITLAANTAAAIRWQDGAFLVGREKLRSEVLVIRPAAKAGELSLDGRRYRGALELRHKSGGLTAVNIVPIDGYLRSVVPEEMPVDWPAEAIKAQSVAARSFALASRGRHASEGYDLCTTTHCQLYTGTTAAEKSASNAAIKATRGEVLTYGGKPIEALFHTDSGGMTENSEAVWGSHVPYLRAAKDTPAKTMPWTKTISRADLERKLAAKGHDIGKVRSIALSPLAIGRAAKDRTASGRVKTMTVKGTKGTATLSGTTWRSLLGLKSTLFDAKLAKDMVTFTGYGSGHGLGISQWGAERMATRGASYADILHHYYTGTKLQQLY